MIWNFEVYFSVCLVWPTGWVGNKLSRKERPPQASLLHLEMLL